LLVKEGLNYITINKYFLSQKRMFTTFFILQWIVEETFKYTLEYKQSSDIQRVNIYLQRLN